MSAWPQFKPPRIIRRRSNVCVIKRFFNPWKKSLTKPITAFGDCLEPFLESGDQVIIDVARKPQDGDLVLINFAEAQDGFTGMVKQWKQLQIDGYNDSLPFIGLVSNLPTMRYDPAKGSVGGVVLLIAKRIGPMTPELQALHEERCAVNREWTAEQRKRYGI